jgi:hypothetical protein
MDRCEEPRPAPLFEGSARAEEKMRCITVKLESDEYSQTIRRREFFCEHHVKYMRVQATVEPDHAEVHLKLWVVSSLQHLSQERLQRADTSEMSFIRDFLHGIKAFLKAKEYYHIGVKDLSLITDRLVIDPQNVFILLEDPLRPELIEKRVRSSRTSLVGFCRQAAYIVFCLATKRLDIPIEQALHNFDHLLDTHQCKRLNATNIKALIESLVQADPICGLNNIDLILSSRPAHQQPANEQSWDLERTLMPIELSNPLEQSAFGASIAEESVIERSKISLNTSGASFKAAVFSMKKQPP